MKRTLKRELKFPEIAEKEAVGIRRYFESETSFVAAFHAFYPLKELV